MAEGLPGRRQVREAGRPRRHRGPRRARPACSSSGTIKHTYPFCWRCGTAAPLLREAQLVHPHHAPEGDRCIDGNERINWYPEHIKNGRFGNWLENNIDWAFSRERYWGTPLPFWKCETCGHAMCCGSKAELVANAVDPAKADALDDFHRPYIDEIVLRCENCGGEAAARPRSRRRLVR